MCIRDSVSFKQLSAEHQKQFEAARAKEANSLVPAGAVRILSLEESHQFEERHPECVLDSLWAERWKATDEKELLAKSRWCVVGWQDPDIHEIERSSPMPRDETINVAAQVIASRQWKLRFRDVKAAFSQSLKSNRRRPIACKQPRGGPFPGALPGQLILLITEVYGLVSGPAWWRVSFVKQFLDRGYQVVSIDRCALVLPGKQPGSPTEGLAILEMDDVLEGGGDRHVQILTDIASKITFGKIKEVALFQEGCCSTGGGGSKTQRWDT